MSALMLMINQLDDVKARILPRKSRHRTRQNNQMRSDIMDKTNIWVFVYDISLSQIETFLL